VEPVPSDSQVLDAVEQAFRSCVRPEHFTNYNHCDECEEHDELLRSRDLHTLSIRDVGNIGWDPICFVSPEGFAYYFPALARLALAQPDEVGWYGSQLLFHLSCDRAQERISACTPDQRNAVNAYLHHLLETRLQTARMYMCDDDLLQTIALWSAEIPVPRKRH
jgi:hypothetical protein